MQVDWPIDVFFPQVLINTYNQIFTFLLQVKFSKWCLIEINVGSKFTYTYTHVHECLSLLYTCVHNRR